MAKRKIDCSLNDIIGGHLKNAKCEKSLKLFEENVGVTKKPKMLKKFFDYLKEKEVEKENIKNEDLGFEINFGAYQPVKKLPFTESNRTIKLEPKKPKPIGTEKKPKKKEIPKEFIKKIKKLGMKLEDAEVLYSSKFEWTAVYSQNKIYCTDGRCEFYTEIDSDILTKHMIDVHNYGEFPCDHVNCDFIGYSQSSLNHHKPKHTRLFEKQFWYKCPKLGCNSSFKDQFFLDIHCRIHENDLDVCSYCPYRYADPAQYKRHLKAHFKGTPLSEF